MSNPAFTERLCDTNHFYRPDFHAKPEVPIILNPAVGRGGVCSFWGAGQGATTRNGATAKGGAVPSAGRCDRAAGCGAMKCGRGIPCAARSPLRGAPRATLQDAPFQGVATLPWAPKTNNLPRSGFTRKVK